MPRKRKTKETQTTEVSTTKRQDLIEVLTKVKPGIANKAIIEQSNYFIFEENQVWTYNDSITISQKFESGLIGAVKADEFYKLLNKLNDDDLKIEMGEGEFLIQGKTVTAEIKIDPEIKLQPIRIPDFDSKDWHPLPKDFSEAISLCLFSASRNMIRPELTSLYVTGKTVFSTDTFRATKRELKTKVKKDFLLPSISAKDLIQYNVNKIFVENEGWLHFSNKENTMFSCRTFAGLKYPEKIWDMFDVKGEKIDLPDSFEQVIDRVATLVTTDFDLDRFVGLIIEKNTLICKGKGPHGSVSEKIDIDYDGEKIAIKVHPEFLMEILKQLNSMIIGKRLLFQGDNFEHVICLSN